MVGLCLTIYRLEMWLTLGKNCPRSIYNKSKKKYKLSFEIY